MAEYWKSTPKYWCKHCGIYVRDTPFERTQHEATGKHQGALKRFLRDIHRSKEQEERESNKAKSEVERLKGLVSGSGPNQQQQQPGWNRTGGGPSSSGASVSRSAAAESRKKQMAQLAEMGVAIPQEFRPEMALAGEWTEVAREETPKALETADTPAATAVGVRKRKLDSHDEEAAEEKAPRKVWGSTIRRHPGTSADDDEELDALLGMTTELKGKKELKTGVKAEVKAENEDASIKREDEQAPIKQEDTEGQSGAPSESEGQSNLKEDSGGVKAKEEEEVEAPRLATIPEATENLAEGSAVVFKKRKPKQMKR